ANLIVQVKNNQVMRVVPLENEAVNECWIADRDRFSYEALNGADRLTMPMLKQGGEWKSVDWKTALEYVAHGLQSVKNEHGAAAIGALVSPHSTLEELYLTSALIRGMGSENVDHRLRHAEFEPVLPGARYLGMTVESLSHLQTALVVGSNLRKDHPLFAQRIRQATRGGCVVHAVNASAMDWAMPVNQTCVAPSDQWAQVLADIAAAVALQKNVPAPAAGQDSDSARAIATSLLLGERSAILLGNAAAHHAQASRILGLANWIAEHTGSSVGYLTEAANTVGAQFAKALPGSGGLNAQQMLSGALKALVLLNNEPGFDTATGAMTSNALKSCEMVVTLSPFKANLDISDVLLPISPFTETSGTYVNAEGRVQSFHAVVKPLGETRPAWKVLRALANVLNLPGFDYESSQEVLSQLFAPGAGGVPVHLPAEHLNNRCDLSGPPGSVNLTEPCVASIYQLDGIVRRASALQMTADARSAMTQGVVA
ncbi:MAG: molybdopterin-dependent oxidoreductase, partial [Rhodoferax sp.]|nr:molybdopterin-dependent oxidoreductase [Rhodoferax sp.]